MSGRKPWSGTVLRTQWLSPSMVRLVLGGGDVDGFGGTEYTDAYVKVVMLHPEADYPQPLDLDSVRQTHPPEQWPRLRTYTVRAWDPVARELTLDFVVHGDAGLAGPWAAAVLPGVRVWMMGPGGGYAPDPGADWHLLVGDPSALPAIAASVERLPADARGHAFIGVDGPGHEIGLAAPAGVQVSWLHGAPGELGESLVQAVRELDFPEGRVHGFVHGEAGFVKQLRRHLRMDRGVPLAQLSISGYWRLGVDDEGWRSAKRDWLREIEEAEARVGAA